MKKERDIFQVQDTLCLENRVKNMTAILFRIFTVVLFSGIFLYYYFKRMLLSYFPKLGNKITYGILLVISAVLAFCRTNKWGFGEFLVGHLTAFALAVEVIHLMIFYGFKKKNQVWEKLVRSGLVPAVLMVAVLIYGYFNMTIIKNTEYTVVTGKNIRSQGYDIILMSDIHFGTTMDIKKFREICAEISAGHTDIVVLCGDITDENTTKQEMQDFFQVAGTIQSEFGVFYVYGNHDRQPYRRNKKFTVRELDTAMSDAGIHVLSDETFRLNDEFVIIGREDEGGSLTGNRASIDKLVKGMDMEDFVLVLDHKPKDVEACGDAGCDLQLSGHTHGGQVWPKGLINGLTRDYYYGHETYKDYSVIISSGAGGWGYPFRTGSRSEIVKIHIKPETDER